MHAKLIPDERTERAIGLRESEARQRFGKEYFKADVTDALRYHLVLDTGLVSFDDASRLIAES